MKILFVCSGAEPGRDGVGDYTRRLAAELIAQGIKTAMIAVNDKHTEACYNGVQLSNGMAVPVMRIPATLPVKQRFTQAEVWITQINPEWLSLQFVPFGFDNRGLPFGLSKWLLQLGKGRKWHLMFHELWVGMEVETSQKLIWWGRVQRLLIKSMLLKVKPLVIQTQTHLYQQQLAKLGFKASYLPLFANIPVINAHEVKPQKKEDVINMIVFGEVHLGAPVREFAAEVSSYQQKNNKKITLTFLGKSSPKERERWAEACQAEGLSIEITGEQPEAKLAAIFSSAEFGVSATAFAISDKSGSVAAMRAYGLKILCISRPWTPRGFKDVTRPADIFEYTPYSFEIFMSRNMPQPPVYTALSVSMQLQDELARA